MLNKTQNRKESLVTVKDELELQVHFTDDDWVALKAGQYAQCDK